MQNKLEQSIGVIIGKPSTSTYRSIDYATWVDQCAAIVHGIFKSVIVSNGSSSSAPIPALDALATLWQNFQALALKMKLWDANHIASDIPQFPELSIQASEFAENQPWAEIGQALGFAINFDSDNPLQFDVRASKAWESLLKRIQSIITTLKKTLGLNNNYNSSPPDFGFKQ